jgi:hypothetical protein
MRIKVHSKYAGRCAYCGDEITLKQMQIDHIKPLYRGHDVNARFKGTDTIDNMHPSCRFCNNWKSVMNIEEFREQMEKQVERVRRDSAGFRMMERYGLVKTIDKPVTFWFEQYNNDNQDQTT